MNNEHGFFQTERKREKKDEFVWVGEIYVSELQKKFIDYCRLISLWRAKA